jgi:hypothetical protein
VTDPGYTDAERIAAAKGATWVPSTHKEAEAPAPIPILEISPDPEPKDAAAQMSQDEFSAQMMDAIQHALKKPAAPPPAASAAAGAAGSPLFSSFSQDELIAVMQGLRLLSFEPGDIIIGEGEARRQPVRDRERHRQGLRAQGRQADAGALDGRGHLLRRDLDPVRQAAHGDRHGGHRVRAARARPRDARRHHQGAAQRAAGAEDFYVQRAGG